MAKQQLHTETTRATWSAWLTSVQVIERKGAVSQGAERPFFVREVPRDRFLAPLQADFFGKLKVKRLLRRSRFLRAQLSWPG
ncbi:MAG: hypothetical protein ACI8X5_001128 [Planctomycetota bacterium]|jgi:hypothetical protein